MSAQRFTAEQIEAAAHASAVTHCSQCGNYVFDSPCGPTHLQVQLEQHVIPAMLRAFALQTRQVEQMREWMAKYWEGTAPFPTKACLTCKWAGDVIATGVDFPEQECSNPKFGGGYWAMPCGIGCTAHEPKDGGQ